MVKEKERTQLQQFWSIVTFVECQADGPALPSTCVRCARLVSCSAGIISLDKGSSTQLFASTR